jgi:2,4-dienoyl-CoA reductase-like NADH-dependent reductase (Old Yellow Enzyme family)
MTETVPALFTPFSVRGVGFSNRIVMSPMCQYQAVDGCPTAWHIAHHGRYATSGIGGAIAEATGVLPEGRITHGCTGIYNEAQVEAWKPVTAIYHHLGIPIFLQIGHAGPKASTARPWDGAGSIGPRDAEPPWETVAPSAIPARMGWHVPRALEIGEMPGIVSAFAEGAKRALEAGFDGIEIHGAHGYLLHAFMSPVSNRRTDAYGGTLEGRMRLPLEVARAVREAVPDHVPVFYRASCVDGEGGLLTLSDTVALAKNLKALGIDLIDASGGGIPGRVALSNRKPEPGFQVPYAARIREEADIPTMAVGRINDPQLANQIIAEGKADLVALAKGLMEAPDFAYRAAKALGLPSPASILPPSSSFHLGG